MTTIQAIQIRLAQAMVRIHTDIFMPGMPADHLRWESQFVLKYGWLIR